MTHPSSPRWNCPCIRVIATAFFLLLLVQTASATTTQRASETCPICDTSVTGLEINSTNSGGGIDLDFCPHAHGSNIVPMFAWNCTNCGFCAYRSDFTATATIDRRREIKDWLTTNLPPASFPVNAWERYEIMARLAEHVKKSDREVGNLYLRAAWCCRDAQAVDGRTIFTPSFGSDEQEEIGPFIKQARELIKGAESTLPPALAVLELASAAAHLYRTQTDDMVGRPYFAWFIATLYRSRGEHRQTLEWIETIEKSNPAPDIAAGCRHLRQAIELEKKYQTTALDYLRRAAEQATGTMQLELLQQAADTLRRLGTLDQAEVLFLRILDAEELPKQAEQMALAGLQLMGKTFVQSPERREELRKKRSKRLLEDLNSSDRRDHALSQLSSEQSPEFIEPLLRLLETAEADTQPEVIRALIYDDPRVIKALISRLDDHRPARYALYTLKKIGNPGIVPELIKRFSQEPFVDLERFKELGYESLVSLLADALGFFGGPQVTQALCEKSWEAFVVKYPYSWKVPGQWHAFDSPEAHHLRCCYELARALGFCDDKAAVKPLTRALLSRDEYLVQVAGTSLERLTNQHFGFSKLEVPGEPTGMEREPSIQWASATWRTWYEANRNQSREEWVKSGFEKVGLAVYPASEPARLKTLIDGLEDTRANIRYNCYMELGNRTGQWFLRDRIRGLSSPIDYRYAADRYRAWLKEHQAALSWDETQRRFIEKRVP